MIVPLSFQRCRRVALVGTLTAAAMVVAPGCGPRAGGPATYTVHPRPSPVQALASRDGELWAGTRGGLVRWSRDSVSVFTAVDGLPSSDVTAVAIDRAGTAWAGTPHGLARIRRRSVRSYDTDAILDVAADAPGRAWAIAHFVGKPGSTCVDASFPSSGSAPPGDSPGAAYLLQIVGGKARRFEPAPPVGEPLAVAVIGAHPWVGGASGAARWDGSAWQPLEVEGPVSLLRTDADGRVWMATAAGLVAAAPDGRVEALTGGAFFRGAARPRGLGVGATGLWVATAKAFYQFDGESWFRRALPRSAPESAGVVDLAADAETGSVYGATPHDVYVVGGGDDAWATAPRGGDWLKRPRVVSLLIASGTVFAAFRLAPAPTLVTGRGTLLGTVPSVKLPGPADSGTDLLPTLGTGTGSLRAHLKGASESPAGKTPSMAVPGAALPEPTPPGSSSLMVFAAESRAGLATLERVNDLAALDRWLLVAADGGLYAVDLGSGDKPMPIAGTEGLGARAVAADGGSAWAVLQDARTAEPLGIGEILVDDAGALRLELRDLAMAEAVVGEALSLSVMPGGAMVWVGATGGVARVGGSGAETFRAEEGPGAGPFLHVAVGSAGVVWAVGCDGVAVFAGARWTRTPFPEGLGPVQAAVAGQGTLWLGVGEEIFELSTDGHILRGPWPSPGGPVTALAFDDTGALWVGAASGAIARIPDVVKR